MSRSSKWFGLAALGSIALAGLDTTAASAQFLPGANPFGQPGFGMPGANPFLGMTPFGGLNPYFGGRMGSMASSPLGGGSPYYSPGLGYYYANPYMYADPYGGYMRGAADVINAQGRYWIQREQSRQERERTRQMRLETQRKIYDEWLYERERMPKAEDLRQQAMRDMLSRSLNEPPMGDVRSGAALNSILGAIEGMAGKAKDGEAIPLDEDTLKKINVTKAGVTGNIGLLRNGGKLQWPRSIAGLPGEDMAELRKKIEARAREAYNDLAAGRAVEPSIVRDLERMSRDLSDRLSNNVNGLSFEEHREAKRFMRNLDEAIQILQQPDAGEWIDGRNVARGRTVQELVKNMSDKGLRFAPAVGNSDNAYLALHRALVRYYNSLASQVAEK